MYCGTKDDIISIFDEAKHPLNTDTRTDLNDAEKQLEKLGLDLEFALFEGKCRVCGYKDLLIVPVAADLDNVECENCDNMSMQEKEESAWWQE